MIGWKRTITLLSVSFVLMAATSRDALKNDFETIGILLKYETEGVRVATEVVPRGVFLSLPVAHRRTGVLTQDVHYLKKDQSGTVFVKAGAAGFSFAEFSNANTSAKMTWCFSEIPNAKDPVIKCVADMSGGAGKAWAVGLAPMGKYNPILFEKGFGGTVEAPQVARGPAKVHADLRMECQFLKWGKSFADVRCLLGGQAIGVPGTFLRLDRATDGSLEIETPAGRLRLTPNDTGAHVAVVRPQP
jgi:hypothetical protein